ncbi:hypothetical protein BaRGS_00038843 [Batillaria attramentaria]|uniref:Bis(monoacylglycero)phosphate synthase CLN5 n=1 Tax=Batillaria attramentaria TaxID=370345 RepID=A0ABD0J2F2_9CAEN
MNLERVSASHMIAKMAMVSFLASAVVLLLAVGDVHPFQGHVGRPQINPYCQAVVPFCANGRAPNTMPSFDSSDTLFVYALKAPRWEFTFGDLLANYHIMRDAVGFHHVQSGANFTMEWSGLGDIFNCTFPHELNNGTLVWCNQAATCISNGIDEKHWREEGMLVKVAEINGTIFSLFANWTEGDNATSVFYETWSVWDKPGGKLWYDSFDSSSWVQRAFAAMAKYGATFNQSVHLNYTRINIYSGPPQRLGGADEVFTKKRLAREIRTFYKRFQPHQSVRELLKSLYDAFFDIVVTKQFFLFHNETYWLLPLEQPLFSLTYEEVPLPKS